MHNGVITPSKPETFKLEGRLHEVGDKCVMARLTEDLAGVCGRPWFAMLVFKDGCGVQRGSETWMEKPDAPRQALMRRVLETLNNEIPHQGHWVVAWHMNEDEMVCLFRDQDGDLQFTVDFAQPVVEMIDQPTSAFIQTAQQAWSEWYEAVYQDVGIRQEDTFKRALGEKSAGSVH